VVFGSHDGKVRIIDAMTGAQLWNYDTGERVLSTPCILDGWVYIGGSCGRFFAFH
jgi:outer membrane protein assembly factor BamB